MIGNNRETAVNEKNVFPGFSNFAIIYIEGKQNPHHSNSFCFLPLLISNGHCGSFLYRKIVFVSFRVATASASRA